jgi:outer membrane protein assembly factor BamB
MTGALRWRRSTPSSVTNTVAVDDQGVFAVTVTGHVFAWDPVTGASRWTATLGDTATRFETSSPTAVAGFVYAGRAPRMEALHTATGIAGWIAPSQGIEFMPNDLPAPAVSGNRAVFGTSSGLFALSTASGQVIWNYPGYYRTATIRDSTVYAVGGAEFKHQYLSARNLYTGAPRWTSPADLHNGASSPAVSGSMIVIGTGDGLLRGFDAATGVMRWTFVTGASTASTEPYEREGSDVASSPAISGSVIYAGATDGMLYALDLASGSLLWKFDIGVPARSSN